MRNDTAEQRKKPMQSRENTERSDFATVELEAKMQGTAPPTSRFGEVPRYGFFYKVEWANETGEPPRFVRLSRFA